MKEITRRPMTVLIDEALAIYLSTFFTSPDFLAADEAIQRQIDDREEPNTDDWEDLDTYLSRYE
jgi:hypothetical protein